MAHALKTYKQYSEYKNNRRYKNRLSEDELILIQKKFDFNNLYDLDEVVILHDTPYLLNYYNMLNNLNNIRYIIKEQLKPNLSQYDYKNYEKCTNNTIHESLELDQEVTAFEAAFHQSIISTYKEDKIFGSMIIKSLQMPLIDKLKKTKLFPALNNSRNFQRKFSKVNFTEADLYRGFSKEIYWTYANKNYVEYEETVRKHNSGTKKYNSNQQNHKDYKVNIPLIEKSNIESHVKEIFEIIFPRYELAQIRASEKRPNILKYYDDIAIPTIKDISNLEKDFFKITKYIFPVMYIFGYPRLNEMQKYQLSCMIRAKFY